MTSARPLRLTVSLLLLAPFLFGTSPLPPPYHRLEVSGQISRASGGDLQNFVVTLVGRFPFFDPETTYEISGGLLELQTVNWQAVTDTAGRFTLDVSCSLKPDSIALKVSAADRPAVIGAFIPLPEPYLTITQEYTSDEPGCGECSSSAEVAAETVVRGYRYRIVDWRPFDKLGVTLTIVDPLTCSGLH